MQHSEAKLLLEMKQTVTRVFKMLATAIKERGSVPVAVAGFSITGVFPPTVAAAHVCSAVHRHV